MSPKIPFMILILLTVTACTKDKAKDVVVGVKNFAIDPQLEGDFKSVCQGSDLLQFHEQVELSFTGNKFDRRQVFYSDDSCQKMNAIGAIQYVGEFEIRKAKGKSHNEIDLNLQKVKISPTSDVVVTALNTLNFCGREDYQVGKETNVTSTSDNVLCPITNVPVKFHGVYKVDGQKIYLGSDFMKMAKDPAKRDADVAAQPTYSK